MRPHITESLYRKPVNDARLSLPLPQGSMSVPQQRGLSHSKETFSGNLGGIIDTPGKNLIPCNSICSTGELPPGQRQLKSDRAVSLDQEPKSTMPGGCPASSEDGGKQDSIDAGECARHRAACVGYKNLSPALHRGHIRSLSWGQRLFRKYQGLTYP